MQDIELALAAAHWDQRFNSARATGMTKHDPSRSIVLGQASNGRCIVSRHKSEERNAALFANTLLESAPWSDCRANRFFAR